MYGGNAEMQFWPGTKRICGDTGEGGDDDYTLCKYYGPSPHEEHHALWHVHDPVKPGRGGGYLGSHRSSEWRLYPNAGSLLTGNNVSLGSRITNNAHRRSASIKRHINLTMCLWGCHFSDKSGTISGPDSLATVANLLNEKIFKTFSIHIHFNLFDRLSLGHH